jgi:methionyl-tRNA synthetase
MRPDGQKVLITAALLYANGTLHFGHLAGAYLAADCYARFQRLMGRKVLFLSGSDEYGVAITLSAELANRSPREHVDHYHEINKRIFESLDFSFNHYSRTTWPGHREAVHQYFLDLLRNGFVEARESEQLYSEAEGRFLADRYVIGTCPRCHYEAARGDECPRCGASFEATDLLHPLSRLTRTPLVKRRTNHWFLCLDRLAPQLHHWISTRHWKTTVVNFLQHYLDDLRPRAITRDGEWGVPIPLEEAKGKVFYVWFEALIGYISAAREWAQLRGDPDSWKEFWCDPDTRLVQFIGKDNIFFHGLFFPAMTMGQDQPYKLVDDLPANEFLNLEGRQFSKSDGWTIDLPDFLTRYSADQIRYTLAANAPETADSEFTWRDFEMRCNTELVGKLGNLANRSLVFAQRHCEAQIPPFVLVAEDRLFLEEIGHLMNQMAEAYDHYRLRQVCQMVMELASLGNGYFNAKQPWTLTRGEDKKIIMQTTIYCCLHCLQALAVAICPLMPRSASRLWELLGIPRPLSSLTWQEGLADQLCVGTPLPEPQILFEKVAPEQIAAEQAQLRG